jgi:hypothetical protein
MQLHLIMNNGDSEIVDNVRVVHIDNCQLPSIKDNGECYLIYSTMHGNNRPQVNISITKE